MTYIISDNAGNSSLKNFHLVKAAFNATYNISGVSNTNPIVITTTAAHGLATGTVVTITDVIGSAVYTVSAATWASPIRITTTAAHGLLTGDTVTVAGVAGNTGANGTFAVTVYDTTKFYLDTSVGNATYTGSGTVTAPHSIVSGQYTITNTGTYTFSLDSSTGTGTYVSGGVVLVPAIQYWTDSDIPLTALGKTWIPNGIVVGNINITDTTVAGSTLVIQNADYQMSGLVYNPLAIRNVPIDIYEAWLDPTVTNASVPGGLGVDIKYLFSGIIGSGVINRQGDNCVATYVLALAVDQTAVVLPRRLLTSKCTVLFKGPACQYAGHAETCDRTLVNCKALGNQANYGGFTTMPTAVP
jgi:hypothetical protein